MTHDVSRHQSLFSPADWGDNRVDVIGAGATGSALTLALANLGVRNIHVWDFDKVEGHNVANQMYGPEDVDRPKVEALADVVSRQTGVTITPHAEAVTAKNAPDGHVVFLLTDTMESRREIAAAYARRFRTKAIIETRLGTEQYFIHTFKPLVPSDMAAWEATLSDEAEAETSACGTALTIWPTVMLLAGMATWQFIRIANGEAYANRIFAVLRPHMIHAENWNKRESLASQLEPRRAAGSGIGQQSSSAA